ncbi:hypothetical protein XA68_14423 [Ophiocordyceps unilateralis]|uniref:Ig-like domain-containing protein n=1 Tax=Ophiocordyceps unilateralis TaxID=268505 RepID=A0A2A9PAF8_OPHUN|nr:hypothetical protein XA68_14423 [Ophiocordyceps unilateralis]
MAGSLYQSLILSLSLLLAGVSATQAGDAGRLGLIIDNPYPNPSASSIGGSCNLVLPLVQTINLGPVKTVYTATVTKTRLLECAACAKVTVSWLPLGIPPVARFTTTETAKTASTTSVLGCRSYSSSSSTKPSPKFYGLPRAFEKATVVKPPNMSSKPTCTSSTLQRPGEVPGATYTAWTSTVTSTSTIDCGNCALAWSTAAIQFLVPVQYTATVSPASPSTKTDFECLPTDEPY